MLICGATLGRNFDVKIGRIEAHLNNIEQRSLYRKENTTLHHYKDIWLTPFKEIMAVNSENHTKNINTNSSVIDWTGGIIYDLKICYKYKRSENFLTKWADSSNCSVTIFGGFRNFRMSVNYKKYRMYTSFEIPRMCCKVSGNYCHGPHGVVYPAGRTIARGSIPTGKLNVSSLSACGA
jgi:hypothetical protein